MNSIKERMSLSPVEMADELSMTYGDCLIVEGQSDKFFLEHLHKEGFKKRQIRIANKKQCSGNKEYVKRVISIINERHKNNVIGIIDLDYDLVNEKVHTIDNLYYYKYIDLENVLIQSAAFSEVNKLISSSNKIKNDDELRNILYEKTYILGILRLLNGIERYNFSFENIDYKKILEYNDKKIIEYFMSKMNLNQERRNEILSKVNSLLIKKYDYKYICNGHDLICILSQLTKKTISNDNPIKYTEEILEKMLILGYRKTNDVSDILECSDIIYNHI